MELTVLGMNGPFPAPGSGCSGYLLTAGNTAIQLDLGCGTLARLTGMTPPEDLTALVFSELTTELYTLVRPEYVRLEFLGQGFPSLSINGVSSTAE